MAYVGGITQGGSVLTDIQKDAMKAMKKATQQSLPPLTLEEQKFFSQEFAASGYPASSGFSSEDFVKLKMMGLAH